jgi:hypothetical protein
MVLSSHAPANLPHGQQKDNLVKRGNCVGAQLGYCAAAFMETTEYVQIGVGDRL